MSLLPLDIKTLELPERVEKILGSDAAFRKITADGESEIYCAGGNGLYLKTGEAGSLKNEAEMTAFLHGKNLAAEVVDYISEDRDYLIVAAIAGIDGGRKCFADRPRMLCDKLAQALRTLHEVDLSDCPVTLSDTVSDNGFDGEIAEYIGVDSREKALSAFEKVKGLLKSDAVVHGSFCSENVLFCDFKLSGFINLGLSGMGDRHIDIARGAYSLMKLLGTDSYKERFFDAYGRELIDSDRLGAAGLRLALRT